MNANNQTDIHPLSSLRCLRCASLFPAAMPIDSRGCPLCSKDVPLNLRPIYKADRSGKVMFGPPSHEASMWRYHGRLPLPSSAAVSLGEGLTPLMPAKRIGVSVGLSDLLIKDESRNPTSSYKDRFSSVAVSLAKAQGVDVVATASSGNAGASLAAYAAHAGMECVVATFAGSAGPMLSQIRKLGATVLPMADKADRWAFLDQAASLHGWFITSPYRAPVVGSHPIGIEGYKTIAYELVEQCGDRLPDWCVMPVCYGDGMAGIWAGFEELLAAGVIDRAPRLVAAEVHGSLSDALSRDLEHPSEQKVQFDTLAISIGAPCSTYQALAALRRSGGHAVQVTNAGLIDMQERLARTEGIFAELSAVSTLIAIERLTQSGIIRPDERVVALITSSGLKDLDQSAPTEASRIFQTTSEAWSWLSSRSSIKSSGKEEPVLP